MLKASLLLLVVVAAAGSLGPTPGSRLLRPHSDDRIVGGHHAYIDRHPWHLSYHYDGTDICSASVINSRWALTAARCVYERLLRLMSIRAGSPDANLLGTVYGVSRALYHYKYKVDDFVHDYDVAVIKIDGSFSFSSLVQPVRLATEYPPIGTVANLTGFGARQRRWTPLFETRSVIVGRRYCEKQWALVRARITENMMCANNTPGGFCDGDYGAPLMVGNTQYGIASWQLECNNRRFPSVYASVVALRNWITYYAEQ